MSSTTISSFVSLILLLCVFQADCYGSGAPMTACDYGNPIHHSRSSNYTEMYVPQSAPNNPFRFLAHSPTYQPGKGLRVTISGSNGELFKGFFLQARAFNSNKTLGVFSDLPALTKPVQCTGTVDDSVTHTGKEEKEALSFLWTAPEEGVGDIIFIGSVALGHSTFYVNMASSIIAEGTTGNAGILQVNLCVMVIGLIAALIYTTDE
ncbi:putative defense protein 3 isoform X3 [Strongylocentrotus purpuratus]|uniref:Reelin domain-containing protein n=1 Tax=Strongylocentrotus purpuratus TaxID=7668 RepID=A0A7M7NJ72_STRPU|nr:putative defense protein 3 isoform X3 [Strongylocentrotus purpuratus]